MNLLILLVLLCLLLIVALILCNGDVLEPFALSIESFLLVVFVAFAYNRFSIADISGTTILYIFMSLLIYGVGYLLTKGVLGGAVSYTRQEKRKVSIAPNKKITLCILCVQVLIIIIMLVNTLTIARSRYADANVLNMLMYTRNAYLFTDSSLSLGVSIGSFFVTAVGYFYVYLLADEITSLGIVIIRNRKIEIVTVVMSLLAGVLGTSRTFLIKFIVISVIMFYYSHFFKRGKRSFSLNTSISMVKKIIVLLVLFFICFQLLGIFTKKTGTLNVKDMIYGYSGASVVALDRGIENYVDDGRFFGEESFYGLYGFLNSIGIHVPNNILHLPMVDVGNGMRTNVYTSLRTYLYDFGHIGMFIAQFLLGVVSAIMYVSLRRNWKNPNYLLIYGILIYGTAMQGISEITLRNFMSITNVFLFIFFMIVYYLTQRKIRIR